MSSQAAYHRRHLVTAQCPLLYETHCVARHSFQRAAECRSSRSEGRGDARNLRDDHFTATQLTACCQMKLLPTCHQQNKTSEYLRPLGALLMTTEPDARVAFFIPTQNVRCLPPRAVQHTLACVVPRRIELPCQASSRQSPVGRGRLGYENPELIAMEVVVSKVKALLML